MTLAEAKKNLTATEDAFRAGTATFEQLSAARAAARVITPGTRAAFLAQFDSAREAEPSEPNEFDPAREAERLGIPHEPVCRRCDQIGSECGCEPCGDFA